MTFYKKNQIMRLPAGVSVRMGHGRAAVMRSASNDSGIVTGLYYLFEGELLCLDYDVELKFMVGQSTLAEVFANGTSSKESVLSGRHLVQAAGDARASIEYTLDELRGHYGNAFRATKQEIALMSGISREMVGRVMKQMRREGILANTIGSEIMFVERLAA